MNPDETYDFCRYELIEVIVEDYSSISTKKLCKSDDSAYLSPVSFAYDSSTDTYIVMSQSLDKNDNSLGMTQFSFIDGTTGDIKKDLKLEKYLFNKVRFNPSDGYVYASGSFINQNTGKDVASFAKIDISTGTNVGGKPVLYPCRDLSLNSNFDDFVIDGNTIILGGYTDADYEMGENTKCPYIVSYNAKEGKTIYEREYEDLKGFKICGINFSEIGSLLLDIFSDLTGEGYIVSTGLLAELPKETKLTLPQSTSIKSIAAPDYYTVLFESDSEQYIDPYTVQRGKEIAVAPEVQKDGVAFAGWFLDKNFNQRVEFPYVPDFDAVLYAEWKSPPELVSCTSTRISSSCVEIQIVPSDDKYFECYHIICYKTVTSRAARVVSRYPPVRELFLDVKTKDSFYRINGPEGTYLINLYVIDTFGQQSKVYAATIF